MFTGMTNQQRGCACAGVHVWLPGLVAGVDDPAGVLTTSAMRDKWKKIGWRTGARGPPGTPVHCLAISTYFLYF